jgi:hypothetical protein
VWRDTTGDSQSLLSKANSAFVKKFYREKFNAGGNSRVVGKGMSQRMLGYTWIFNWQIALKA